MNESRPTPHEVARVVRRETTEPEEVIRVLDWCIRDPEVEQWFNRFQRVYELNQLMAEPDGDDLLSADSFDEVGQILKKLNGARLAYLRMEPAKQEAFAAGELIETQLLLSPGDGLGATAPCQSINCTLSAVSGEPGVFRFSAPALPADVEPLNFTVANLGLPTERAAERVSKPLKIGWSIREENAHKAAKPSRERDISRAPTALDPMALPHETIADLSARSAKPETIGAPLKADGAQPASNLRIELAYEHSCTLQVSLKAKGTKLVPVIVECEFPSDDGGIERWRKPLLLTRRPNSASEVVFAECKVPLLPPVKLDAIPTGGVQVSARTATAADLPWLDSHAATECLAEFDLIALPLERASEGFRLHIRDDALRNVTEATAVWLLRWAPAHKEAQQ